MSIEKHRDINTPTKRQCSRCGVQIIYGWKLCDSCSVGRKKIHLDNNVHYTLSDVRWIVISPFEGANKDDHFWRTMYEVIAYDSSDSVVDSMEFDTVKDARTCSEILCNFYGAKMI